MECTAPRMVQVGHTHSKYSHSKYLQVGRPVVHSRAALHRGMVTLVGRRVAQPLVSPRAPAEADARRRGRQRGRSGRGEEQQ